MKAGIFLLMAMILFASCEQKDCCVLPEIELRGVFEHRIPNCQPNGSTPVNCVEWLEFLNDSEVDVLYGGSDIVERFTYTQGADFVSLEGPPTSSFRPTFIIRNDAQLERSDTGDIWEKQ